MQIKNWLNRKRIALIGLLIIVLISAANSFPGIREILDLGINLNKASDYICLEQGISSAENVLFLGNPFADPTHAESLAMYYRSQYFLAPRLVVLLRSEADISSSDSYRWFISTSLNQDQLAQLQELYALAPVKDCGDLMLLQKQARP